MSAPEPYASAESWEEFLKAVSRAAEELGEEPKNLWFRGQSDPSYELIPSLLRHPQGMLKEQQLFRDYSRHAEPLQPKRDNEWEVLFDMQHYGIPTRLLDWTETGGVAVAFALYDMRETDRDAEIFVLNPFALNARSGDATIREAPLDPSFDYPNMYWRGIPTRPVHPIAFRPRFQNPRLAAQRGTFTIQGSDPRPLDVQLPECVRRIRLRSSARSGALDYLTFSGIDPAHISPDLFGLARHLIQKHLNRP
jgi:hypothetical protein